MEHFDSVKELASKKGTYVSTSSSSSNESFETVDAVIQSPLPVESSPSDSSNNLIIVTREATDAESDCDESSVRHETFEGNVETPTVPQEKSSDEQKNDVSCDYIRENFNKPGNRRKKKVIHKMNYFVPIKEDAYVSTSSSSNESFETVDADIQPPIPFEYPLPDSSNNLNVTHEVTDTESDCDESSVRHETSEGNVKSSDELRNKKYVSCDYIREKFNKPGNRRKKKVKHKMKYFIPNKELAIKEGTSVSTSSSSNESFETDADIQPPLPLEYPLPDSSNNLSIVTHEVTDTESDCDESSVRHETSEGNVETPTVSQEKSSDEQEKKKNDSSCAQQGSSKKVLKRKIKNFNPVKELAIMRGTYVSTSSSSNESFETEDADIQSPLPDSSNNLSIVTHEVTDTESEGSDSPALHKKFKGNAETSTVPQEKSSDQLQKTKKYVCRDYIRGNCARGDKCKFSHEYNLTHLHGVYTFCHKFQNSTCTYANCKYVHADVFEERNFYRTGILPPYALAHIRTGNSPPPEPEYLLEDPRQTFSSFHYLDPSSQTQAVWPRMF